MDQLYADALSDWNKLTRPHEKHRKPNTKKEQESFDTFLEQYKGMYGAGVGEDVANVAGLVGDVAQLIPGGNVVANVARAVNVVAETAERATKERELAAEQADAYRKNAALQQELYQIKQKYDGLAGKEEMRQQRNLVLQSADPRGFKQNSKFKAIKAEAIRQLQEEGKTPREVEMYYRQRIAEIQADPKKRAAAWENRGQLLAAKERTVSPQEQAEMAAAQAKYAHRPLEEINYDIQALNETPGPVSGLIGVDVGF
jgi:hypothetical protein